MSKARDNEPNDWLSTAQAARLLGISERSLRALIARGQLPAWRWGERTRWRISRRAVERAIQARQSQEHELAQ